MAARCGSLGTGVRALLVGDQCWLLGVRSALLCAPSGLVSRENWPPRFARSVRPDAHPNPTGGVSARTVRVVVWLPVVDGVLKVQSTWVKSGENGCLGRSGLRFGCGRGRALSTGRNIAAQRSPGVLCSGWMWARSGPVCQFRVCSCALGCYTRSVGNAPLLIGCSAPDRVHGSVTGAALPLGCCFWWCGCMGRGRLWALSCL